MATYIQPRQPFGSLDGSRLQALGSVKNCQNAISIHEDNLSPIGKSMQTKSNKRAFSPDTFANEFDSENIDPNILASPSKKARGFDGAPVKSSKAQFNLITTPANSPAINRKSLSLSVPTTSNITPISHSRGSPKHKRVGLLSKARRASSSPFRRVEPPKFKPSGAGSLPFSIDAALSGTISSYKPKTVEATAEPTPAEAKPMPKSWFFAIHEDTPEEEAANLMEHSASTLDISSDDDTETKRQKLEEEIGKENVPPPDWCGPTASRLRGPVAASGGAHKGIHSKTKVAEKEGKASRGDVMLEDRAALGALDREDFFPDGLDEGSIEVIDEQKRSSALLAKEAATFDFVAKAEVVEKEIVVHTDEPEREVA